ncbi:MAG: single-stranded DNA-binding protein [Methylococcales bacterium]|nr:single-stranded DNA-binding protein [Methylococcales bacterium]
MLNKVTLIGRLGADPEVKYMPSGGAVTNIGLATTRRWKDRQTGERRDETEWHRVTFFNRVAEVAGEYLRKGSLVYIEGRIRTRKWQDQNGQDRYTTEIIAEQMQMLDSKSGGTSSFNDNQAGTSGYNAPQQSAPPPANKPQSSENNQQLPDSPPAASYEDFDDDIPF